jgi:hypothetical protein
MSLLFYSIGLAGGAALLTYLVTARKAECRLVANTSIWWAKGFRAGAEAARPKRDPQTGRFKAKPSLNPSPCTDKPQPKGIAYHVAPLDRI